MALVGKVITISVTSTLSISTERMIATEKVKGVNTYFFVKVIDKESSSSNYLFIAIFMLALLMLH